MARQLVIDSLQITLPELNSQVSHIDEFGEVDFEVDFKVAESSNIELQSVEPQQRVGEDIVDLLGKVEDYSFAIYFTHPGRVAPLSLQNFKVHEKLGVVEVDLSRAYFPIINAKKSGKSYSAVLRDFIENDSVSKKWLFHPRYARRKQEAEFELEKKMSAAILVKNIQYEYSCGRCSRTWVGTEGESKCLNCNSPLHSHRKKKTQ